MAVAYAVYRIGLFPLRLKSEDTMPNSPELGMTLLEFLLAPLATSATPGARSAPGGIFDKTSACRCQASDIVTVFISV